MTTARHDFDNLSTADVALRLRIAGMEREGNDYVAPCPIHGEQRGKSLRLYGGVGKGWYCFGACRKGGDAAALVMSVNHCDFKTACDWLGVELRTGIVTNVPAPKPAPKPASSSMLEAARRYRDTLLATPRLLERLLTERGLTRETVERFGLGYCPPRAWSKPQHDAGEQYAAWSLPVHDRDGKVVLVKGRLWEVSGVGKYMPWEAGHGAPLNWCMANPDSAHVVVCAGDFDAISLAQLGFNAVSVPGQGSFKPEYVEQFAGFAHILVLFDPGEDENARKVVRLLQAPGRDVRYTSLAYTGCHDASQALVKGMTRDEMGRVLDDNARYVLGAKVVTVTDTSTGDGGQVHSAAFTFDDIGNAERLVHRYGERLRYSDRLGGWQFYDGIHWQRDEKEQVKLWAIEVVRAIADEARELEFGSDEAKRAWKHIARSQSAGAIAALLSLAQAMVFASPEEFDTDPNLINTLDGVVDLRTGEMRPHHPSLMLRKLAPVHYTPGERPASPIWDNFINRIFQGKQELVNYVQACAGYSATAHSGERVMFMLTGNGDNGKSTMVDALMRVLGDYAEDTPQETLLTRDKGAQTNDLAALYGARFVSVGETEQGRRLNTALVKKLAGGTDRITARFLNHEFFTFQPTFKIWLHTNHKPMIPQKEEAIWTRIKVIPFNFKVRSDIPAEEGGKDKQLPINLMAEDDAIFAWVVEGAIRYYHEGLTAPTDVVLASAEYKASEDTFAQFLEDCTLEGGQCLKAEFKKEYLRWCAENHVPMMKRDELFKEMMRRGYGDDHGAHHVAIWRGLTILKVNNVQGAWEDE